MDTLLVLFCLQLARTLPSLHHPVIGVYTQPYDTNRSYIAASYVKYLQMSGAQVVPLFYSLNRAELTIMLSQLNGVLIPGGSQNIDISNRLTQNADSILNYSLEQSQKGIKFPVWGTCAGHGMLGYLTSKYNVNTRQPIGDALGIMNTLHVVRSDASMLNNIPERVFAAAEKSPGIAYFYQHWAIYTDTYRSDPLLKEFWDIVTTSISPAGKEYITAWHAKSHPIYSVQFHPEKSNFEWRIGANHSREAQELSQLLSNNFVQVARSNPNRFASESELFRSLIYNYATMVPDDADEDYNMFTQLYLFEESEA